MTKKCISKKNSNKSASKKGKNDVEKIKDVIEKLRPFLINDGGNIEFIKYEDNIVYIRLGGACASCSLIDLTLREGVEMAIQEEVPAVKAVINLPPDINDINELNDMDL